MQLSIDTEREADGRWIAAVPELPGTQVYGETRDDAIRLVKALALRVIADRVEHGEPVPSAADVFAEAA
jgi:predicted RNase H-like HicB family nuclease